MSKRQSWARKIERGKEKVGRGKKSKVTKKLADVPDQYALDGQLELNG